MKLSNIADLAITEIQKTLVHKSVVQTDWIYDSLSERNNYFWLVAFAVLLRVLVVAWGLLGITHAPRVWGLRGAKELDDHCLESTSCSMV